MFRTRSLPMIATIGIAGVMLAGCGSVDPATKSGGDTPTAAVASSAPTEAASVSPAPQVGESVAAGDVDSAREAGASVYVSPRGDGSGLVVDPTAPLPQLVRDDMAAASMSSMTDAELAAGGKRDHTPVSDAMADSGLRAFVAQKGIVLNDPSHDYVTYFGGYVGGYWGADATDLNAGLRDFAASEMTPTPEEYIAVRQGFIDTHPAEIVIFG